jgi:hypothetical protein
VYKVQVKDERQDEHTCPCVPRLLTPGSSGAATYLVALAPATRPRGSSGTATCPVALAPVSWHRTAPGPPRAPWQELRVAGYYTSWRLDHHGLHRGGHAYLPRHYATRTTLARRAGRLCCRPVPAQHRPAVHLQWFATVWSGSPTLGRQLHQTGSYNVTIA